MIDLHLSGFRKARMWIGDLPITGLSANAVSTHTFPVAAPMPTESRRAALEVVIPVGARILYGLFGAELKPGREGEIRLEMPISSRSGMPFDSPIAPSHEDVRAGLPEEYHSGVIDGVNRLIMRSTILFSGVLAVTCAAHGAIGSSPWMFRVLTEVVVDTLCSMPPDPIQEEVVLRLESALK